MTDHAGRGTRPNSHRVDWVARGLRRAASDLGVNLPLDYAHIVAADGLSRAPDLGVTRLGTGVVLHTAPSEAAKLPAVLGYADASGQWHRDGKRHIATAADPAVGRQLPSGVAL